MKKVIQTQIQLKIETQNILLTKYTIQQRKEEEGCQHHFSAIMVRNLPGGGI